MNGGRQARPNWVGLVFLLAVGGIAGSIIGDILVRLAPGLQFLGTPRNVGLNPSTLDLNVFTLTFGFSFSISLFTLIGLLLAFLAYRRM